MKTITELKSALHAFKANPKTPMTVIKNIIRSNNMNDMPLANAVVTCTRKVNFVELVTSLIKALDTKSAPTGKYNYPHPLVMIKNGDAMQLVQAIEPDYKPASDRPYHQAQIRLRVLFERGAVSLEQLTKIVNGASLAAALETEVTQDLLEQIAVNYAACDFSNLRVWLNGHYAKYCFDDLHVKFIRERALSINDGLTLGKRLESLAVELAKIIKDKGIEGMTIGAVDYWIGHCHPDMFDKINTEGLKTILDRALAINAESGAAQPLSDAQFDVILDDFISWRVKRNIAHVYTGHVRMWLGQNYPSESLLIDSTMLTELINRSHRRILIARG